MKKRSYSSYLFLAGFLLLLFVLSSVFVDKMRFATISAVSPLWKALHWLQPKNQPQVTAEEWNGLCLENQLLRSQVEGFREWVLCENSKQEQWEKLAFFQDAANQNPHVKEFYKRREREVAKLISLQAQSVTARVIFREPVAWSSVLWLDVGEETNRSFGREIVVKNSPVVLGSSLVGVVEQVEEKRCRVRLITDASLTPAVRAVRGQDQNRLVLSRINALLTALDLNPEKGLTGAETQSLRAELQKIKEKWRKEGVDAFLAKGILYGSSSSYWHSRNSLLKGVGFNYDFADEEGKARPLRSSQPPLIMEGDLLVTTGLDGLFPPGLQVAQVTKVFPLKEGAISYDIEALPIVGNLHSLDLLSVLPPPK